MSEYREFTADLLTYEELQHKVLENEAGINALKDNPSGGGGSSGGTASVTNSTGKDAIVIVDKNSALKLLTNTYGFEYIPVIARNSSQVDMWLVSDGVGGRIVARTVTGKKDADGNEIKAGNICTVPAKDIPDSGDFAASVDKVNARINVAKVELSQAIAGVGSNVGDYIAYGGSMSIPVKTKGWYIIRGGTAKINGFSGDGELHIIKFFTPTNGGSQQAFHLYQKPALQGYLGSEIISFSDSTITVTNTDDEYGSWVIHEN